MILEQRKQTCTLDEALGHQLAGPGNKYHSLSGPQQCQQSRFRQMARSDDVEAQDEMELFR